MTIIARTAPKFCAHIRAALAEMFFLDLISLVISGTIEPWPECQPEACVPREGGKNVPGAHSVTLKALAAMGQNGQGHTL